MTHPRPETVPLETLTAIIDDIRRRVPEGDSFEGNLTWSIPENPDAPARSFDVVACYRIGNSMGQGGMRMIGDWSGEPEPTAPTGHDLARQLIARHGTDRYPWIPEQALKVAAETGELADAILKHQTLHDGCPRDQLHGATSQCPHIRKEYADAGLALYELGTKLGIDLLACMTEVVDGETRTFAVTEPRP